MRTARGEECLAIRPSGPLAVTDIVEENVLTMHTRIAIPETTLGNRFSGGK